MLKHTSFTPAAINRLPLLLLLLLIGCAYNRFDTPTTEPAQNWNPTQPLYTLRPGTTTQTIVVQGVVTSTDSTGNFYKELLIEHQGTLRLAVGLYDLYALYPRGTTLAVRIEPHTKLAYAPDGVLTLALAANANGIAQTIHRQPKPLPWHVPTPSLDQLKTYPSGTTLRIDGVHCVESGVFSGEATIQQGEATAQLVTSPYASFAEEPLPVGRFDLVAVVVGGKLKISDPATDIIPW